MSDPIEEFARRLEVTDDGELAAFRWLQQVGAITALNRMMALVADQKGFSGRQQAPVPLRCLLWRHLGMEAGFGVVLGQQRRGSA